MSGFLADHQPLWPFIVLLAAHVALGAGLGVIHFGGLWSAVRRLTDQQSTGLTLLLFVGRFLFLIGVLVLVSLEGAAPLLATAFGLLVMRSMIVRRLKRDANESLAA